MDTRSAKEIWEATKGALQVQVTKANYQTWLKDTVGASYHENQFVVGTPSAFAKEWLEKRLYSLVRKTLISVIGHDIDIQFQVCFSPEPIQKISHSLRSRFPPSKLNQKYTFDNFVVGGCNRLAYAAALAVAEEPSHQYNPLVIHGGSGVGKTHLAQAIGNTACENGFDVVYASTEQFTNEFIKAIRERKTEQFQDKFRSADLLIIEDIQFITGKTQTQHGLFHTFNELYNANRQIVITGDQAPRLMSLADGRLRSRFEYGLITPIQPPDPETRFAILQSKAAQQQVHINEAIIHFIAQRCQTSVWELESSLNRLCAYTKLTGKPPTLELAQQAMQDVDTEVTPNPTSILHVVTNYFDISPEALIGRQREQQVALARQITIYLLREKTNCSLQHIGQLLGGRDRSSILQSYHKTEATINTNPTLQQHIQEILARLHNNP